MNHGVLPTELENGPSERPIQRLTTLTLHGASGTSGVLFAPGVLGANDRVHAHGRPVV